MKKQNYRYRCVCVCEKAPVWHTQTWICGLSHWKVCCILHTIPLQHTSDHSWGRCQSLKTHKETWTIKVLDPPPGVHTSTSAHVEIFTVEAVVPSLSPHCVITELLNPCGSVMTDYDAGTEREVSHNRKTPNITFLCLIFTIQPF